MAIKPHYHLIIIPSPGKGHLQSALQLANLLINRDESLSISVLLIRPLWAPNKTSSSSSSTSTSSSPQNKAASRVSWIHIPPPELAPYSASLFRAEVALDEHIKSHTDNVRDEVARIVKNLGPETALAAFVVDMFCTGFIDVANEFSVPTYVFYPSGSSILGLSLHVQSLMDDDEDGHLIAYENSSEVLCIPSYRLPVPGKMFTDGTFDTNDAGGMLNYHSRRYRETKGILVNTFRELEIHGTRTISEDPKLPPIYPIGPIIYTDSGNEQNPRYAEIMKWLDQQQDASVVFLCFGSMGCFNEKQVKEIAIALERSGHRFLWSLRKPPQGDTFDPPGEYEDPAEVMPENFLQRTAHVGKVIGWAPQLAVLSHPAVGGFVSHCGWNSFLESLMRGIPIAAWPVYAEQQLNAFLLVKDLRLAVEIKIDYKGGSDVIVSSDAIENGIKLLMEPGSDVRANVEAMKVKSWKALAETGSAFEAVGRFLQDVRKSIRGDV